MTAALDTSGTTTATAEETPAALLTQMATRFKELEAELDKGLDGLHYYNEETQEFDGGSEFADANEALCAVLETAGDLSDMLPGWAALLNELAAAFPQPQLAV
ncbi:MAG: hypothetical protein ABSB24_02990 [Gaiellaceae bacterium]|jgi:hypothetical protein